MANSHGWTFLLPPYICHILFQSKLQEWSSPHPVAVNATNQLWSGPNLLPSHFILWLQVLVLPEKEKKFSLSIFPCIILNTFHDSALLLPVTSGIMVRVMVAWPLANEVEASCQIFLLYFSGPLGAFPPLNREECFTVQL